MIPPEANLSVAATDLIRKMICDSDRRLGRGGAREIKEHPFFDGTDWDGLRDQTAPYSPPVSSPTSNENFDQFEEEGESFFPENPPKRGRGHKRPEKDLDFVGYTYKADVEAEKRNYVNALNNLDQPLGGDPNAAAMEEAKISRERHATAATTQESAPSLEFSS